jgi:Phosphodiester glycosidase
MNMGGMGDQFNAWIDNLLAAATRLLELPLFMLLLAGALLAVGVAAAFRRRRNRILIAEAVLLFFAAAFAADRKIARLQDQLNQIRSQNTTAAAARAQDPPKGRQKPLFDLAQAQKALVAQFPSLTLRPLIYDQATDIVQMRSSDPLVQAYAAVIDLTRSGLSIVVGGSLESKSLTSAFARQNHCTVAINGEAGLSAAPDAALAWYRGDMVQNGKVLLRELPVVPRPYLYFDRDNQAGFVSSVARDRSLTPRMYNVIWGRLDAIIDGQVQTEDERYRQPRTAMGINQDGSLLYLLVVDGRQPNYSMGITRAEVGEILKALGAWNGMLCDEGGSSCMYVSRFGGICDIPSDNQGQERPTYTHFGICTGD